MIVTEAEIAMTSVMSVAAGGIVTTTAIVTTAGIAATGVIATATIGTAIGMIGGATEMAGTATTATEMVIMIATSVS
jgi:hypothetical protein